MAFLWLLPSEHKANETKDNKNGTSLFAELKPLYANSVGITKNNVQANIWKLYMIFEANKEFMENLSLQSASIRLTFRILCTSGTCILDSHSKTPQSGLDLAQSVQRFGVRGFWKWVKWRQHVNSLLSYSIKTIACDRYSTKLYVYSSKKLQS